MRCYSHLSDDEREQIGLAKALGHSISAIIAWRSPAGAPGRRRGGSRRSADRRGRPRSCGGSTWRRPACWCASRRSPRPKQSSRRCRSPMRRGKVDQPWRAARPLLRIHETVAPADTTAPLQEAKDVIGEETPSDVMLAQYRVMRSPLRKPRTSAADCCDVPGRNVRPRCFSDNIQSYHISSYPRSPKVCLHLSDKPPYQYSCAPSNATAGDATTIDENITVTANVLYSLEASGIC